MQMADKPRASVILSFMSNPFVGERPPLRPSAFQTRPKRFLSLPSGGDPFHNAQDPSTLLGKMLRIDVDVEDDDPRGYRVPEDNPFVDNEPVRALH